MTSDAGVPGAPRFDVVLRGYDRRQVDEHVDRLQRVLARMRADLEVARSQPMPAVAPPRPAAARPRPTPRPRPGGPADNPDNPDTIGNFTDRMETILQSAEEEAAEIRRNAHLAARAETDGVRSQVADLIRQRDAVLAELTRMRSQLEGLLAAPTAQMPTHESDRYGRPDPAQRPDLTQWPSDQGFRPAGGPGADPGRRSGAAPSTGPQPPVGPGPSGAPRPVGSASAGPTSAAPTSAPASPAPGPGAPAPAGSVPQQPAAGGVQPAGSTPAVSPTSVSPTSVTPVSGSQRPGSSPAPSGQSAPAAPSSARPDPAPSSGAPSGQDGAATTALPAGGTTPDRRTDAPTAAAEAPSGNGTPPGTAGGTDAATGTSSGGPEREVRKAAHRLPTGAYPAVADSSSMRPRSEPDPEPADLFRPVARGAGADPQTTAVPRGAGDAPGERTSVVRRDDRTERGAAPPAAESTAKVGPVRPEEPTVRSPQPTAGRPDHDDGRNGTPRPTSPSRSA